MEYKLIAQTNELPNGNKKKILHENREILILNIEDSFYAVDNKCPHMGGSLYDGTLDGHSIVCPRHGSGFDVRTGKVTKTGKLLFIKVKPKDLYTYPVKIEGTDIFIGIE